MRTLTSGSSALTLAFLALFATPQIAAAGETWNDLKPDVFGERPILSGIGIIKLKAPNRPEDMRVVPVSMSANLNDGRTIKAVTFILDENPMPVAAAFDLGGERTKVEFGTAFRVNRATSVRVVVEASDGKLYMAEKFIKYAGGQSACAAPPEGDPAEIIANMGKFDLSHKMAKKAVSSLRPKATLVLSHPNHTGMVLDQITLLYTPMRMVSNIELRQGEDLVFTMQGSITLAQNPTVNFNYRLNGAEQMHVVATDSNDTKWQHTFSIGQGS